VIRHPANFGRLCTKGLSLHKPILRFGHCSRKYTAKEKLERDLNFLAGRFSKDHAEHGPAGGVLTSRPIPHRDYYVFNKLAKA